MSRLFPWSPPCRARHRCDNMGKEVWARPRLTAPSRVRKWCLSVMLKARFTEGADVRRQSRGMARRRGPGCRRLRRRGTAPPRPRPGSALRRRRPFPAFASAPPRLPTPSGGFGRGSGGRAGRQGAGRGGGGGARGSRRRPHPPAARPRASPPPLCGGRCRPGDAAAPPRPALRGPRLGLRAAARPAAVRRSRRRSRSRAAIPGAVAGAELGSPRLCCSPPWPPPARVGPLAGAG